MTTVEVPQPSSAVNVTGTCKLEEQYIAITWGHSGLNNINITFKESKDKKMWHISNFSSAIYISEKFTNATDEG